ncbi:MAG: serine protease Do [Kiritimatiellia bacterium]|jgi:serine protease Do
MRNCRVLTMFNLFAVGVLFSPAPMVHADLATLKLADGYTIKGEVLKDTEEFLVVDLGFEIIRIPRKSVLEIIQPKGAPEQASAVHGHGLFVPAHQGKERTVQSQVKLIGEAVVDIRSRRAIGSGFVIHPDGYIVTNHHVIKGENTLTVTIFRREGKDLVKVQYPNVRIVALDPHNDLALLKIESPSDTFTYVNVADSDEVLAGQNVFAVGSPLGYDRTVSEGIVSLPGRLMDGRLYLQTTTQINPGNSGGPLFNLKGEVIGVNNMKAMAVGVEGVGFAIPANVMKMFLNKRDAYAFDPRNPNAGFRYPAPPRKYRETKRQGASK